jgi:hypothetical protein
VGSWPGTAGFNIGVPPVFSLSNLSQTPAAEIDSGAAGFSFGRPASSLSPNILMGSTGIPSLGHPAGASGRGTISAGMVYQGSIGGSRVSYREYASASGDFSFSVSYSYQSVLPSSGSADLFSGLFSFP